MHTPERTVTSCLCNHLSGTCGLSDTQHALSAWRATCEMGCHGIQVGSQFRGTFELDAAPFDWGKDYVRPDLAPEDVVVYEMGVRSFTADGSSGVGRGKEGTYAGLMAKARPSPPLKASQHGLPCAAAVGSAMEGMHARLL